MLTLTGLREYTKNLSILYVEDEDILREAVKLYLDKLFNSVTVAKDGREGLKYYIEHQFDIVMSDIQMPIMNGLEMSKEIKRINPNQEIIIISAYSDTTYFLEAIKIAINGYIIKPIDYKQMNQELYKSVTKLVQTKELVNYKLHLEEMVTKRTETILAMEEEKTKNFENTILAFIDMIENRDTYTAGHSQRVAYYAKLIAKEMGYNKEDCELLYKAGIMHDVGKLATPDTILLKPGKLNSLEYKLIQEHVSVGYRLLFKIPMYKEHAEIIIGHHERYDGKGYPNGLKGDEISMLSHILLTADAFDAMTTNRIYKGRKNIKYAISELKELSGKQFHPKVVDSAIKVLFDVDIPKEVTQIPKTEVEKERFAYFFRDQVTDAYNYKYLNFLLEDNIFNNKFCCINKLSLNGLNKFSNISGWAECDKLLKSFVMYLSNTYPLVTICRVHDGDFILILREPLMVDVSEIENLDFFKKNNITINKKNIKLKDKNIRNIEELEKLL